MIPHSARGFSDEPAIPVIGMQSVANLDLPRHFSVMEKTAIPDYGVLATRHDGKLRWNAGTIPAHDFRDESDGLFAFGENAQRKAHEIGIGEQLGHPIDIALAEWSQNQSLSFESWHWKK